MQADACHGDLNTRQSGIWRLAVAVAACAVYALTVGHGFVYDDGAVIVENPQVHGLSDIAEIFTSTEWRAGGIENHLYRPLTSLSYAVNYALTGLAPWSYHLVNVLLHALAAVLVLELGRAWRLPLGAAGLGALLFAVHPLHVEAVANITGRKDVFAALFATATMLLHRSAVDRGGVRLLLPVVSLAAACFAKEVGIVTVGLVLAQDLLLERRNPPAQTRRRTALLYTLYFAAIAGYLLARWQAVGGFGQPGVLFYENPTVAADTSTRILTALHVLGLGGVMHAWPFPQSPDYSYATLGLVETPWDPHVLLACALGVAWLGAGIRLRRRAPYVLLGFAVYALALLPASNLLFPAGTIFGERLLYFPSVGSCLLLGALLHRASRRVPTWSAIALPAAVAILAAGKTVHYASFWSDEMRLFEHAVAKQPNSYKTRTKLGEALINAQRPREALPHLEKAIAIAPDFYGTLALLGDVHAALDDHVRAESYYTKSLALRSDQVEVLYRLGQQRQRRGDLDGAAVAWERALAIDPAHGPSNADYGIILHMRGDRDGARRCWERAVATRPDLAAAWFSLGNLLEELGETAAARRAFQRFVEVGSTLYPEAAERVRAKLERR